MAVDASQADAVLATLAAEGEQAWRIGALVARTEKDVLLRE